MSHVTGSVQTVSPAFTIGPDFGSTPTPGVWTRAFVHTPAPTGTKFLILHFASVSLPSANRLEVDLGYDTDRFTAADGSDFFTRPIDVQLFPSGVPIRYFSAEAVPSGGAQIDRYGRGERLNGELTPSSLSNCDPFLSDASYTEPIYDPWWFCHPDAPRSWENIECVPVVDFRLGLSRSIGMILSIGLSAHSGHDVVSTCSVTLIGPDTILCAGHCFDTLGEDVRSGSVIFNYETACDGSRLPGYSPRFYKVIKMLRWRYEPAGVFDYAVLQIKAPPGLAPIPMRHDLPAVGESAFGVHHPNGAVKKISPQHPGFGTVASNNADRIRIDLDISGGSSGSGLFDMSGRITGVLAGGSVPCSQAYYPTASILQDIASPPAPAVARDVMIVFDRSGSMSLTGASGLSKIQEARDAASLFVQLVRAGAGNKIGLVSFSTTPTAPVIDFPLATATALHKTALIGPPPFSGAIVGALAAGGTTTIGGGLHAAHLQFPAPGANPRTILLMTDGLQNTPPMASDVEPELAGVDVDVIGFGTEANLDGALLSALAESHNGLYRRAGDGLALKKYFALAFGNIFEAGALMDPEFRLPKDRAASDAIPFSVCGEETVTIVAGWDRDDAALALRVTTPSGAVVDLAAAGVEASSGRAWTFARIALPHAGERDGTWHVVLVRPHGGGEFPPPAPELRFFVNVIANGGPRLSVYPQRKKYYTGDRINPLVALSYATGGFPERAKVTVTIARPDKGAGNLLTRATLGPPVTIAADTIPARQATLAALEQSAGAPLVSYAEETHELFDDARHNHGSFEASGVFGDWLSGVLTTEGHYTFHFRASYGDDCVATRELQWATHVDVGIDPSRTTTTVTTTGTNPDGTPRGTITIAPRDGYGNDLGPGRAGGFTVDPVPGTTVTGAVHDNGDGTYTVPVGWDPGAGPPGVIVTQPGRPPVVVREPSSAAPPGCMARTVPWWVALLEALVVIVVVVILRKR
jgi:hypothetical protein